MDKTTLKLLPIIILLLFSSFTAVVISESSDADSSSVHTVKFMVNGGTGTTQEWKVQDGNIIELPTSLFSRDGYYLLGWSEKSDDQDPLSPGYKLTVDRNMTLYAIWDDLSKYGQYDADMSKTVQIGQEYVYHIAYGEDDSQMHSMRPQDPNPAGITLEYVYGDFRGWEFKGMMGNPGVYLVLWYKSTDPHCFVITVPSESDTICTLEFDTEEYGDLPDLYGPRGTAIALPGEGTISRQGYSLAGWDVPVTEGTGTFALNSYFTLDGSYTATAHWLAEANVVILDGSGQIGNQIDAFVGYNQQTITLPSEGYSKEGSTFAGWRLTSAPDEIFALGYIYTIEGPTYMTAYYIPNGSETATVTFDSNGGVGTLSQTVESGKTIVLPERGFSNETNLEGWTSSADGETYSPGDRVKISEDTTFSAVWGTEAPDVVTVTFDLNGGSGSAATQILNYGDKASKPTDPAKSASIFAGWFQVGGGEWDFDEPVTSSITLRADWTTHFTRSYQGNIVLITLEQPYVGSPTTVDWGDGTTSTGSVSFSHQYDSEMSGIITVTTSYGLTGDTVSSSIRFQVSGGGTDPEPIDPDEPNEHGIPMWAIILALIAVAAIILVAWRLS